MTKGHMGQLGARLSLARQMAGQPKRFADVGADHGRLTASLLLDNQASTALLTDISAAALQKAVTLIHSLGLENRAEFAQGDGLSPLAGQSFDTVFILGMGGETVSGILQRGFDFLNGAELIVSGQTELPRLRETVCRIGYHIEDESIAREKDRWYFLLRCVPGLRELPSEKRLFLGEKLLEKHPDCWKPYLQKQESLYTANIAAMLASGQDKDKERTELFQRHLIWVREALAGFSPENDMTL